MPMPVTNRQTTCNDTIRKAILLFPQPCSDGPPSFNICNQRPFPGHRSLGLRCRGVLKKVQTGYIRTRASASAFAFEVLLKVVVWGAA